MRNRALTRLMVVFLLAWSAALPASAAPPLPGAIFTTTANGSQVNGNIFQAKCDVYLDGGPGPNAPAGAAGLPDGDYYFQVTDPSGQVLLSTDPVANRQFRVLGGVIVGLSGAGNHVTGVDIDQGAATIQLCPFLDTPNNGGVYKVWVTPIQDFVGDPNLVDNGYAPGYFHGFLPPASKTDNFKVKHRGQLPCLTIIKFYDANGNGVRDGNGPNAEPLLNWPVIVLDPNGAEIQGQLFTSVTLCNLVPGTYRVIEAATDNPIFTYAVTASILDGVSITPPSQEVLVQIGTSDRTLIFGNTCTNGIAH